MSDMKKTVASEELAQLCVELAENKKGKDSLVLEVKNHTIIADYFVLITANNDRHIKAIADELITEIKEKKRKSLCRNRQGDSGWMILDYGDVIVHLFLDHIRRKYALESLWKDCPVVIDNREQTRE